MIVLAFAIVIGAAILAHGLTEVAQAIRYHTPPIIPLPHDNVYLRDHAHGVVRPDFPANMDAGR
jgi:hypothetical protein